MDIRLMITQALKDLKNTKPLIHHITNLVVMNETANATLAIGASPVMAHAIEEVEEMASVARALVLNIGTLTTELVESMIRAGLAAGRNNTPIILDPVGAGATTLRTEACRRLLSELDITIIRGNASEAAVLAEYEAQIKGVDAMTMSHDLEDIAKTLAVKTGCVAAVTGPVDIVSDGVRIARISHGHPMMAMVTGTGCIATSIVAGFASVIADPFTASVAALTFYDLAGEAAAAGAEGLPGSYHVALYDSLAKLANSGIEGTSLEVVEAGV